MANGKFDGKSVHSNRDLTPLATIGGYYRSFFAFSAITALWVFLVRSDDFYTATQVFGLAIPATTVFYLLTMPAIGFFAGQWRFYQDAQSAGTLVTRSIARLLQFFYAHILIVLFTAAMVSRAIFDINIDGWIQEIDDSFFVLASRFAPWLAAYLAGFNLGRALGLQKWIGERQRDMRDMSDPLFEPSRHAGMQAINAPEPRAPQADASAETGHGLQPDDGSNHLDWRSPDYRATEHAPAASEPSTNAYPPAMPAENEPQRAPYMNFRRLR